jgi:hypothetical protein
LCRSAEIFPFSSNFRRKKVSPNVEKVCNSNRFISALDLIFVFLRETKSRLHLFRVRDIISSLKTLGGKSRRAVIALNDIPWPTGGKEMVNWMAINPPPPSFLDFSDERWTFVQVYQGVDERNSSNLLTNTRET